MRQIIDYFLVVNDFSKNVFLDYDFSNHPVNFSNHPVPLSKEGSTFSPRRVCHKSMAHPFLFFAFSQIRNL